MGDSCRSYSRRRASSDRTLGEAARVRTPVRLFLTPDIHSFILSIFRTNERAGLRTARKLWKHSRPSAPIGNQISFFRHFPDTKISNNMSMVRKQWNWCRKGVEEMGSESKKQQDVAHEPECSQVEHFGETSYVNSFVHFSPVTVPVHCRLWNAEWGGVQNAEREESGVFSGQCSV